jgi:hypothetical protein
VKGEKGEKGAAEPAAGRGEIAALRSQGHDLRESALIPRRRSGRGLRTQLFLVALFLVGLAALCEALSGCGRSAARPRWTATRSNSVFWRKS